MSLKAIEIAEKHLKTSNPSMWGGDGDQPSGFDTRIITYPIDQGTELDISFEYEESDGWLHLCELREKASGDLLAMLHGYGIDSVPNLADTIEDICNGRPHG